MDQVPTSWLWIGFFCALVPAIGLSFLFGRLDRRKIKIPPHYGIVDFELAGNVDRARAILQSWRDIGWPVRANLALDMAFIPFYSAALFFGGLLAGRALPSILGILGPYVAASQLLAGVFDYGENAGLLLTVSDFSREPSAMRARLPQAAAWCARMKFRLITLGLIYAALGGIVALVA